MNRSGSSISQGVKSLGDRRVIGLLLFSAVLLTTVPAHAVGYDWQLVTKTNPPVTMFPGEKYDLTVVLKNAGTETWYADETADGFHPIRLGTVGPRDRQSVFASDDPTWLWSAGRRIKMETPVVPSGGYAVFVFTFTAPALASYPQTLPAESFAPLAEGLAWMDATTITFPAVVVNPIRPGTPAIPNPSLSPPPCIPLGPKTDGARRLAYQDGLPPAAAAGYGPGVPLTPSTTSLSGPRAVAIDNQNDVVVADTGNNRVLRLDPASGFPLANWGSAGSGDGQFQSPSGVAVSASGLTIYVADTGNNRIQSFGVAGYFVGKFGTAGSAPGQFSSPRGIAVIPSDSGSLTGDLVIADSGNDRVQIVTPAGASVAVIGASGHDPGQLTGPTAVAVYGGYLYVTDTGNNRVQKFTLAGDFAGEWGGAGTANGCMSAPSGIAAGALGVFVADSGNNRIERFARNGAFIEAWGGGGTAAGNVQAPAGIALTKTGTVWAAERVGNRTQSFAPAAQAQPAIQCSADPVACVPPPPSPPPLPSPPPTISTADA